MNNLNIVKSLSNVEHSPLSKMFFSDNNIEILQNNMKKLVYQNSREKIGDQSIEHLLTIMHSIYREMSFKTNDDNDLKLLNNQVLNYTVPMIINSIKQYRNYYKDASQLYTPMDRSVSTTIKGENGLTLKPFF